MPCYHPLHGYYSKALNPTGKRSIVFKLSRAISAERVSVSCGKCIGCKLESSRQTAVRGTHEVQMHEDNSFLTLTYAPEHLPPNGTLVKKHHQDFLKRVRKKYVRYAIDPETLEGWPINPIRYLHCGEYGEKHRRPHYHTILFGLRFMDQQPYSRTEQGHVLHTSAALTALWPFGLATVGEATFESIAYVARYIVKKLDFYGEKAYEHLDLDTGELSFLQPEYTTRSLKPAIGKEWYARYRSDVYPSDEVIVRGKAMKPPKYYDTLLERADAEAHAAIKERRKEQALLRDDDASTRRLAEREVVKLVQTKTLKRSIE